MRPYKNVTKDEQAAGSGSEQRSGERRTEVVRALIRGNLRPRRRVPRRADERGPVAVDWHHPQWLAVALLIVLFSVMDATLTLELMRLGAYEANPLMAPLVGGSPLAFALVKIGLTAAGVVLLTQIARLKVLGRLPVGALLYGVLALYAALILYELHLIDALSARAGLP